MTGTGFAPVSSCTQASNVKHMTNEPRMRQYTIIYGNDHSNSCYGKSFNVVVVVNFSGHFWQTRISAEPSDLTDPKDLVVGESLLQLR